MFWLGIELDQQHIDNPEKTHVNVEICSIRKMVILLFFLAMPHSMQDLSSPTRDQTHAPCSGWKNRTCRSRRKSNRSPSPLPAGRSSSVAAILLRKRRLWRPGSSWRAARRKPRGDTWEAACVGRGRASAPTPAGDWNYTLSTEGLTRQFLPQISPLVGHDLSLLYSKPKALETPLKPCKIQPTNPSRTFIFVRFFGKKCKVNSFKVVLKKLGP